MTARKYRRRLRGGARRIRAATWPTAWNTAARSPYGSTASRWSTCGAARATWPIACPGSSDTLVNVWSVGKGVVALAVAMLVERGKLDYAAPVAQYWPEFAANGKQDITVDQVMSHQAGLDGLPVHLSDEQRQAWSPVIEVLEAMKPNWPPGSVCVYHPETYGYLAGELVRRVDGRSIGQFVAQEIAEPLALSFYFGLPEAQDHRAAQMSATDEAYDWVRQGAASAYPHAYRNRAFSRHRAERTRLARRRDAGRQRPQRCPLAGQDLWCTGGGRHRRWPPAARTPYAGARGGRAFPWRRRQLRCADDVRRGFPHRRHRFRPACQCRAFRTYRLGRVGGVCRPGAAAGFCLRDEPHAGFRQWCRPPARASARRGLRGAGPRPPRLPLPAALARAQAAVREQEGGRVPALAGHALGASVRPWNHSVKRQSSSALTRASWASCCQACSVRPQLRQRHDPEAADEGPDAAVVVLVRQVLLVARHVGPPQRVLACQRVQHHAHRIRSCGAVPR